MRRLFGRLVLAGTSLVAGLGVNSACSGGGGGGAISCADGGTCPANMTCQNGACVAGQGGSAGSGSGGASGASGGSGGSGGVGGVSGSSGTGGFGGTGGVGGGTGGIGGTSGTSGTSGVGGAGGSGAYVCDNQATGTPTPGDCTPDDPGNPCQVCVQTSCCNQFEACLGTNPNNPCAYGAPDGSGEIYCILTYVAAGMSPPQAAAACVSPACGTISQATNDLYVCLDLYCFSSCFN